jgi:hypothetical protein
MAVEKIKRDADQFKRCQIEMATAIIETIAKDLSAMTFKNDPLKECVTRIAFQVCSLNTNKPDTLAFTAGTCVVQAVDGLPNIFQCSYSPMGVQGAQLLFKHSGEVLRGMHYTVDNGRSGTSSQVYYDPVRSKNSN